MQKVKKNELFAAKNLQISKIFIIFAVRNRKTQIRSLKAKK